MGRRFSEAELEGLDKKALVSILLAQQDQLDALNRNMELLIEQISAANQHRFGRHSEKAVTYEDGCVQLTLFNEAEYGRS